MMASWRGKWKVVAKGAIQITWQLDYETKAIAVRRFGDDPRSNLMRRMWLIVTLGVLLTLFVADFEEGHTTREFHGFLNESSLAYANPGVHTHRSILPRPKDVLWCNFAEKNLGSCARPLDKSLLIRPLTLNAAVLKAITRLAGSLKRFSKIDFRPEMPS